MALDSQINFIFKVSYLRRDSKVSQLATLSVAASILRVARLSTPKMVFATRKGYAFKDLGREIEIYPTIGLRTSGESIYVNFGHWQDAFKYDVDSYDSGLLENLRLLSVN